MFCSNFLSTAEGERLSLSNKFLFCSGRKGGGSRGGDGKLWKERHERTNDVLYCSFFNDYYLIFYFIRVHAEQCTVLFFLSKLVTWKCTLLLFSVYLFSLECMKMHSTGIQSRHLITLQCEAMHCTVIWRLFIVQCKATSCIVIRRLLISVQTEQCTVLLFRHFETTKRALSHSENVNRAERGAEQTPCWNSCLTRHIQLP